ncbi:MAG: hypothetical protein FJ033_03765 [Chloroflexi bacterium]|nr:hypothetical protein [Chloroflexota bacterium]
MSARSDPPKLSWSDLKVCELPADSETLNLEHTLDCAQSFRWRRSGDSWIGTIGDRVFRLRRSSAHSLEVRSFPEDDALPTLAGYLQLDTPLGALRSLDDPAINVALAELPGLRVTRQPVFEAIVTYLASAANNVTRITRTLDRLVDIAGEPIAHIDGRLLRAFPSPQALACCTESHLRGVGLGFRAPHVRDFAVTVALGDSPVADLISYSGQYREDRRMLCRIGGVGPKIADCVCLFGMGHHEAVPVDTHVWAIARRLFPEAGINGPAPDPCGYERAADLFRARFGPMAGWAQQYLFHARRRERSLPSPSAVSLQDA